MLGAAGYWEAGCMLLGAAALHCQGSS